MVSLSDSRLMVNWPEEMKLLSGRIRNDFCRIARVNRIEAVAFKATVVVRRRAYERQGRDNSVIPDETANP